MATFLWYLAELHIIIILCIHDYAHNWLVGVIFKDIGMMISCELCTHPAQFSADLDDLDDDVQYIGVASNPKVPQSDVFNLLLILMQLLKGQSLNKRAGAARVLTKSLLGIITDPKGCDIELL